MWSYYIYVPYILQNGWYISGKTVCKRALVRHYWGCCQVSPPVWSFARMIVYFFFIPPTNQPNTSFSSTTSIPPSPARIPHSSKYGCHHHLINPNTNKSKTRTIKKYCSSTVKKSGALRNNTSDHFVSLYFQFLFGSWQIICIGFRGHLWDIWGWTITLHLGLRILDQFFLMKFLIEEKISTGNW